MSNPSHTLFSDRPIKSESEDILGFGPFADALAKSLTEMAPEDGLVISVEGEWGAGKTSAIGLTQQRIILRELSREMNTPIADLERREWESLERDWKERSAIRRTHIIRFNPWNFSGQENLVRAFFKELGAVIGHPPDGPIAQAIKKITDYLPTVGTVVGGGVGAATVGIPGAGVGAATGKAIGQGLKHRFAENESLEIAKEQLSNALKDSAKRIIIIVDDLDRLLPSEMRAVFSLVKSLGDLPCVFYVLSFDRQVVTEALSKGNESIEPKFLSKIVQVQLKLPPPWEPEIRQLFFNRLNAVIGDASPNDINRWQRVFLDVIAHHIRTPRDVSRFVNTLQVIWPNVVGDVDLTDLILLTVLQLFEPTVYESIFENIEDLAGETVTFEDDKLFAARFQPNHANNPPVAKRALAHLFSKLAKGWSEHIYDGTVYLKQREQRRIGTREYYRNYFLFGRDPDRVSRSEIETVLVAEDSASRIANLVERLEKKKSRSGASRVAAFLDQVFEIVFTKPLLSNAVVRAILELSDDLIRREDKVRELFVDDNFQRLSSILNFGLEPLDSIERAERVQILSSHPIGLTLSANVVARFAGQYGLYGDREDYQNERMITRSQVEAAVAILLARIRAAVKAGDLFSTPQPMRLLWIWRRWTSAYEVKSWLAEQLKSEAVVIQLAQLLPTISYRSSSKGDREVRSFNAKTYEEILDAEVFKERLREIANKHGVDSDAYKRLTEFLAAEEAGKNLRE
jgi:predicted KAP-like P-loop ATPase